MPTRELEICISWAVKILTKRLIFQYYYIITSLYEFITTTRLNAHLDAHILVDACEQVFYIHSPEIWVRAAEKGNRAQIIKFSVPIPFPCILNMRDI